MFLDDLLDPLLLEVLVLVLLHVEDDVSATPNRLHVLVTADGERTTSGRLPQVLLIIIVLCSKIQADALHEMYHIGGKFGGELKFGGLACDRQIKSANISYLHPYICRSLTEPRNLNPPLFLQ